MDALMKVEGCAEENKFEQYVEALEVEFSKYHKVTGRILGEDFRTGILMRSAPAEVRTYLMLHTGEDTPYDTVRSVIGEYIKKKTPWVASDSPSRAAHTARLS